MNRRSLYATITHFAERTHPLLYSFPLQWGVKRSLTAAGRDLGSCLTPITISVCDGGKLLYVSGPPFLQLWNQGLKTWKLLKQGPALRSCPKGQLPGSSDIWLCTDSSNQHPAPRARVSAAGTRTRLFGSHNVTWTSTFFPKSSCCLLRQPSWGLSHEHN